MYKSSYTVKHEQQMHFDNRIKRQLIIGSSKCIKVISDYKSTHRFMSDLEQKQIIKDRL